MGTRTRRAVINMAHYHFLRLKELGKPLPLKVKSCDLDLARDFLSETKHRFARRVTTTPRTRHASPRRLARLSAKVCQSVFACVLNPANSQTEMERRRKMPGLAPVMEKKASPNRSGATDTSTVEGAAPSLATAAGMRSIILACSAYDFCLASRETSRQDARFFVVFVVAVGQQAQAERTDGLGLVFH